MRMNIRYNRDKRSRFVSFISRGFTIIPGTICGISLNAHAGTRSFGRSNYIRFNFFYRFDVGQELFDQSAAICLLDFEANYTLRGRLYILNRGKALNLTRWWIPGAGYTNHTSLAFKFSLMRSLHIVLQVFYSSIATGIKSYDIHMRLNIFGLLVIDMK